MVTASLALWHYTGCSRASYRVTRLSRYAKDSGSEPLRLQPLRFLWHQNKAQSVAREGGGTSANELVEEGKVEKKGERRTRRKRMGTLERVCPLMASPSGTHSVRADNAVCSSGRE